MFSCLSCGGQSLTMLLPEMEKACFPDANKIALGKN